MLTAPVCVGWIQMMCVIFQGCLCSHTMHHIYIYTYIYLFILNLFVCYLFIYLFIYILRYILNYIMFHYFQLFSCASTGKHVSRPGNFEIFWSAEKRNYVNCVPQHVQYQTPWNNFWFANAWMQTRLRHLFRSKRQRLKCGICSRRLWCSRSECPCCWCECLTAKRTCN